jgi:hypothetical protein
MKDCRMHESWCMHVCMPCSKNRIWNQVVCCLGPMSHEQCQRETHAYRPLSSYVWCSGYTQGDKLGALKGCVASTDWSFEHPQTPDAHNLSPCATTHHMPTVHQSKNCYLLPCVGSSSVHDWYISPFRSCHFSSHVTVCCKCRKGKRSQL